MPKELQEEHRKKLDDIVRQMVANKEPDANIQFVVDDFKKKYAAKPPSKPYSQPSPTLLESRKAASTAEFEANKPESTVGTRSREAAIGVLEPFTAQAIGSTAKQAGTIAYDALTGNATKSLTELWDALKGIGGAVVAPVGNIEEGIRTGDYDRAAYGAGGFLSQTAPAVAGAVDTATEAAGVKPLRVGPELPKPDISQIKNKVRDVAQRGTGASAFKTTKPIVEKFTEASEKVAKKTAEQKTAHIQDIKETLESNREANLGASRAEGVERSIEEGSARLGDRVKDLDKNVRSEGNEKYDAVSKAVKDDPGVPLADLAQAAQHAETNILKGSAENIKQFRELARKAPEEESVHTSLGVLTPGHPLYERLKAEGAINTGGTIKFDDLKGYSTEIGTKLASGGLPGDIYQALKYLKEKIDAAKMTIADRKGAGGLLRNAESFWRSYMDLFYDKDSALTKVRESVGTNDPEYYADAFTKGKSGNVAISKLKQMKSRHANELSGVADLARNLRSGTKELGETKVTKPKPIPEAPKPLESPAVPTAEDITDAKRQAVQDKAARITGYAFSPWLLSGSIIGPLLGEWRTLLSIPAVAGIGEILNRPAVVKWIAQPTEADLAAIQSLPEPARTTLGNNLRDIMEKEQATGKSISVAPELQRLIGQPAIIRNRRDALEKLGK